MRRIVLAVMTTVAAVVVLFGYRTSTNTPVSTAHIVVATGSPGTSDAGNGTSTTPAAPRSSSAPSAAGSTPSSTAAGPSSTAAAPSSTAANPDPTPSSSPTTAAARTGTVTGDTAQTRWGPVQVQLTVSGGRITGIALLQLPSSNGRDAEINDAAVPVLEQETLQAQSAQIDGVSGATYTSEGYIASLQSALDQAGL